MEMMAKDERKNSVLNNVKVRTKQLDKRTYFDKIKKHLEEKKLKTHQDIYVEITKYYVKDGKPTNHNTINGYTNNYMLMSNLMSYEQFYALNNKF